MNRTVIHVCSCLSSRSQGCEAGAGTKSAATALLVTQILIADRCEQKFYLLRRAWATRRWRRCSRRVRPSHAVLMQAPAARRNLLPEPFWLPPPPVGALPPPPPVIVQLPAADAPPVDAGTPSRAYIKPKA